MCFLTYFFSVCCLIDIAAAASGWLFNTASYIDCSVISLLVPTTLNARYWFLCFVHFLHCQIMLLFLCGLHCVMQGFH